MRGRRKSPRNLCADLLKIRWKDDQGVTHRNYATLEDISEGGICLYFEKALSVGTEIAILYPRGRYQGKVKYCRNEGGSYYLGIEFLPGYRWSRREYDPAHLLQLRLKVVEPTH